MTESLYHIIAPVVDIVEDPSNPGAISKNDSQGLFGETFEVTDTNGDFCYGTLKIDGYSGYVHSAALTPAGSIPQPNGFICQLMSHIYPQPSMKTRPIMGLSFLSHIHVNSDNRKDGFIEMPGYGWVHEDHIAMGSQKNPASIAKKFLGTPYLYGGRSTWGLDCSALIQLSMLACGQACLRDCNQQENTLGKQADMQSSLKRGDIVYFQGHVGMMLDEQRCINATSRHMRTCIEDINDLEKIYNGITAVRRI